MKRVAIVACLGLLAWGVIGVNTWATGKALSYQRELDQANMLWARWASAHCRVSAIGGGSLIDPPTISYTCDNGLSYVQYGNVSPRNWQPTETAK